MPVAAPRPTLTVHGGSSARAVVLVLHGGRERSLAPTRPAGLAVIRLIPFARTIRRRGAGQVAVARLRFAVRGWNSSADAEPAPVVDAEWALQALRERFPGRPIGLVGHSMGARTALRVGGSAAVRTVVGLAPWVPPGEPVSQLAGRSVLLAHGTADRVTSSHETTVFADRLRATGVDVELLAMPGGHGMLRQAATWHELAARFVLTRVLPGLDTSAWPPAPKNLAELLERQELVVG